MTVERRESTPMREIRLHSGAGLRVERRAEGDGPQSAYIVGHASVFDAWTTIYEGRYYVWREVVRPNAYRNALAEKQDVRALFNHDANFVLGRTTSGTLELSQDEIGLMSRTLAPDNQLVRDLVLSPIDRRDISGMSFAFSVRRTAQVVTTTDGVTVIDAGGERTTIRYEGDRMIEERELLDLNLFDVSPVTYPAYDQTDVALRSLGERREAEFRGKHGRRLARMRMRQRQAEARLI